jgi:hypothetical protein
MTITKKEMLAMDHTACSIKGVLEDIRVKLKILDDSIKADMKSKQEYERVLGLLYARKGDLEARVGRNTEWMKKYDASVGPFAQRYEEMTTEIQGIYGKAKTGHKGGIKLLEKEFGYHPAFKRPGDTFTASAFLPS